MRDGDPFRHVACQEKHCMGNIFGSPDPLERTFGCPSHEIIEVLSKLFAFSRWHRGINVAWTDTTHADIVFAMVDCHCSDQV